jgi:hypothetical protein
MVRCARFYPQTCNTGGFFVGSQAITLFFGGVMSGYVGKGSSFFTRHTQHWAPLGLTLCKVCIIQKSAAAPLGKDVSCPDITWYYLIYFHILSYTSRTFLVLHLWSLVTLCHAVPRVALGRSACAPTQRQTAWGSWSASVAECLLALSCLHVKVQKRTHMFGQYTRCFGMEFLNRRWGTKFHPISASDSAWKELTSFFKLDLAWCKETSRRMLMHDNDNW